MLSHPADAPTPNSCRPNTDTRDTFSCLSSLLQDAANALLARRCFDDDSGSDIDLDGL